MNKAIITGALTAALTASSTAQAAIYVATFTAGPVTDTYRPPYGAEEGTSFTGNLRYDSDVGKLTGFTFKAPDKTFGLADVYYFDVAVAPDTIRYFSVGFNGGFLSSNNTATVSQELPVYGFAYCNDCVAFTSSLAGVPEPATWGLMILGFGAIAGGLRRRGTAPAVRYA